MKKIIIAVVAIVIILIVAFLYGPLAINKNTDKGMDINNDISGEPKACTMEAKICPNGKSVGRTGPNCEFEPCS